jgi:hydroxymethylpyrimidine/phosphomethylpyrimidine kinase
MVATSGARLLAEDALDAMRTRLLPLATLLTPNIPEAELLLGHAIDNGDAADRAVAELRTLGPHAILLKGGHLDEGETVVDRYDDGHTDARFIHDRIAVNGHGTGCTLASAVAANLCRGLPLRNACAAAIDYVFAALHGGYQPGDSGIVVLDHVGTRPAR